MPVSSPTHTLTRTQYLKAAEHPPIIRPLLRHRRDGRVVPRWINEAD